MLASNTPPERARPQRAFTLIEVLVVVAIIAMLVAVLLPSLAKARLQAREVVCRSNTHQMGVALALYTHENRYYPGHHLTAANSPPGTPAARQSDVLWPKRLLKYMQKQNKIFWCPSAPADTYWNGTDYIVPWLTSADQPNELGTFGYGINDWGVTETIGRTPAVYNRGLGGHVNHPFEGEVKVDRVKRPSLMIAFADNDCDTPGTSPGIWDTAIDPNWYSDRGSTEYPGARHNKGANIVYADGHAQRALQSKVVEGTIGARQNWNNDFRSHCDEWKDKAHWPKVVCRPGL